VPRDERGESFLRAVLDVFLQQNAVVQFQHLQVNAADQGKVTSFRKKISHDVCPEAAADSAIHWPL
jgi:hypothetical protein